LSSQFSSIKSSQQEKKGEFSVAPQKFLETPIREAQTVLLEIGGSQLCTLPNKMDDELLLQAR
jgi:hypothetical protein